MKPHSPKTHETPSFRASEADAACADLVDKTLADVDTADFNAYKEACDNAC